MIAWRAFRKLAEQTEETNRRLTAALDRLDETLERNNELFDANVRAIFRLLDRLDDGEQPA